MQALNLAPCHRPVLPLPASLPPEAPARLLKHRRRRKPLGLSPGPAPSLSRMSRFARLTLWLQLLLLLLPLLLGCGCSCCLQPLLPRILQGAHRGYGGTGEKHNTACLWVLREYVPLACPALHPCRSTPHLPGS